jgi:DDE domain
MLLLASSLCGLFKWRQFEPEMILLAVGLYLRFSLSYRDVEELLAERSLRADHVTIWKGVQRYAPELERRLRSRLNSTNDSWRVDETYIRVKGKWVYLYGCRLHRCDDRLPSVGQARHRGRQALSGQSLGRCEPSTPSGHQYRQRGRLPASHRTTQSRGRSGGELPTIDRCNISTMCWNRIIGLSSVGSARVSIFAPSGELGAQSPATKRLI